MNDTVETVRAKLGIRAGFRRLDIQPDPPKGIVFCDETLAEALIDYFNEIRANPEWQAPDFEEYLADWWVAKIEAEVAQADAEARLQREGEQNYDDFPSPLTTDDEIPF